MFFNGLNEYKIKNIYGYDGYILFLRNKYCKNFNMYIYVLIIYF